MGHNIQGAPHLDLATQSILSFHLDQYSNWYLVELGILMRYAVGNSLWRVEAALRPEFARSGSYLSLSLIPSPNYQCALSALQAARWYCLHFTFAAMNDVEMELSAKERLETRNR